MVDDSLFCNFVVISGNLFKGNTLIFTTSSHIHYVVDIIEYIDSHRFHVKIRRPNSKHYLCSLGTDASISGDRVITMISNLIIKYDL